MIKDPVTSEKQLKLNEVAVLGFETADGEESEDTEQNILETPIQEELFNSYRKHLHLNVSPERLIP